MRPFDWRRDCPVDVEPRRFPPVAGKGRGKELAAAEVLRKMRGEQTTPRTRRTKTM